MDFRVLASALRAAPSGLHPFPPFRRPVTWIFCRMASSRFPHPSVFPAFRPSAKLVPPTTPSADFSAAITSLTTRSVRCPGHDGDLPRLDFAISCSLVRLGRPRYPVFVHRAAVLLHTSFRPRLAATPLRFANPSPPSGWVEDFHLQAVEHARHTTEGPAVEPAFYVDRASKRRIHLAFTKTNPMEPRLWGNIAQLLSLLARAMQTREETIP